MSEAASVPGLRQMTPDSTLTRNFERLGLYRWLKTCEQNTLTHGFSTGGV